MNEIEREKKIEDFDLKNVNWEATFVDRGNSEAM